VTKRPVWLAWLPKFKAAQIPDDTKRGNTHLVEMLRDPRYLLPLALLLLVIAISFALGRGNTHAQSNMPIVRVSAGAAVGTATADDAAIDARRTADLQRLKEALVLYRRRRGAVPSTNNAIVPACVVPTDAGCALSVAQNDLHYADGGDPYWYASDGTRFVLIAPMKSAADASDCPPGLPAELAVGPLFCLKGGGAN
jgi:hypothetical protein